jgi:predicted alpha-1,2-mannosidase
MSDYIKFVDMTFGTLGDGFACFTVGPARPNASVLPGPDTYPRSYSTGYLCDAPIRGFSQTHMSAGAQKYGNFLVSPQIGLSTAQDSHDSEKEDEHPTASEYNVTLKRYGIHCSFTPTEHSVIYKFKYPRADVASIVLDASYNICRHFQNVTDLNVTVSTDEKNNTVIYGSGQFDANTEFCPYYQYFYAVLNKKASKFGTFFGEEMSDDVKIIGPVDIEKENPIYTNGIGAFMQFSTEENEEILFKIGISFKSIEKAKEWLFTEIPEWDYESIKKKTEELWEKELGKIDISGKNVTEEQKRMFYSMLLGCHKNPRDRTGDLAKFGDAEYIDDHITVWDTFRSLYPLYSITNPDFVRKTINSFISRFALNGFVRDHSHAGFERLLGQGGDNVDNVIVEAYLKGIEGVDWHEAYKVVKNNAENWRNDQNSWEPKAGLPSAYREIGYIPGDDDRKKMCCSKSLEYYYNDYLVAQMAKGLGYTEDYEKYIKRSECWKKLWNPDVESDGFKGYIWPKGKNGDWVEKNEYLPSASFRCTSWKPYFYEGTCFEYSFFVPHDIDGLISLMGGEELFCERLKYGIDNPKIICIENQPGMTQSFLANHTKYPWLTTELTEIQLSRYGKHNTPGCDDSGCFSAWYVFATIGIYPSAGQDFYYLTSPKYDKTIIRFDNGKEFAIIAENLSFDNKYIQSVTLNGTPHKSAFIRHSDIILGGELILRMGSNRVNYTE